MSGRQCNNVYFYFPRSHDNAESALHFSFRLSYFSTNRHRSRVRRFVRGLLFWLSPFSRAVMNLALGSRSRYREPLNSCRRDDLKSRNCTLNTFRDDNVKQTSSFPSGLSLRDLYVSRIREERERERGLPCLCAKSIVVYI